MRRLKSGFIPPLKGRVFSRHLDKKHESWQCKVTGKDIEGDKLVFIAGIYEDCRAIRCITVF